MTSSTTVKLATGGALPRVGLGVFQTPRGESTEKTVLAALTKRERSITPRWSGSRALGKSAAQVLLRWGLESGLVVLPKSTRPEQLRENLDVFGFELGAHEAALDALEEGLAAGWDPRGQR